MRRIYSGAFYLLKMVYHGNKRIRYGIRQFDAPLSGAVGCRAEGEIFSPGDQYAADASAGYRYCDTFPAAGEAQKI